MLETTMLPPAFVAPPVRVTTPPCHPTGAAAQPQFGAVAPSRSKERFVRPSRDRQS
jgi:hypothetical protein